MLLEVLGSRFGGVPAEVEARVLASEFGEVRTWLLRLCRAETLTDVFAEE